MVCNFPGENLYRCRDVFVWSFGWFSVNGALLNYYLCNLHDDYIFYNYFERCNDLQGVICYTLISGSVEKYFFLFVFYGESDMSYFQVIRWQKQNSVILWVIDFFSQFFGIFCLYEKCFRNFVWLLGHHRLIYFRNRPNFSHFCIVVIFEKKKLKIFKFFKASKLQIIGLWKKKKWVEFFFWGLGRTSQVLSAL